MAKILDSFEFRSGGNGGQKHPWTEWLDGQIRELSSEDFGGTKLSTMQQQARKQAKKLGVKVKISVNKEAGTIVLQAIKEATAEETPAPSSGKKGKGK